MERQASETRAGSSSGLCNVQDKTFGLKNKKGSKQQKFIQQVQHQVTQGGKSAKQASNCDVIVLTEVYCCC